MSKHTDKKILDLLKQRVLDRDKELEQLEYHKATKEALVEMTALSKTEVDALYNQVKTEVLVEQRKKRTRIIWISVVAAVIVLIAVPKIIKNSTPPEEFAENFDDNSNSWSFSNKTGTGYYLQNGQFVMDVSKETTKIDYIDHAIQLPEKYTITIDASKLSGLVESFGIYIGANSNNFGYFFIRSTGTARCGFSIKSEWQDNPDWFESEAVLKGENVVNRIQVTVSGNSFEFFVNGKSLGKGEMYGLKPTQYSIAVGGIQKIAFDNLKIINDADKSVVYENDFSKPDAPWIEKANLIKYAEFKDGNYVMTVNEDDYCYWASTWIPAEFEKTDEYEIILKAKVINREGVGYYGIMFLTNDNNYITLEVKDERQARVRVVQDGEYQYNGTYSAELSSAPEELELKIEKSKEGTKYFFNGTLVDKIKKEHWFYWEDIDKIALRVCNHSTVAFESLTIRELK